MTAYLVIVVIVVVIVIVVTKIMPIECATLINHLQRIM